jgi:hypothetical protein
MQSLEQDQDREKAFHGGTFFSLHSAELYVFDLEPL